MNLINHYKKYFLIGALLMSSAIYAQKKDIIIPNQKKIILSEIHEGLAQKLSNSKEYIEQNELLVKISKNSQKSFVDFQSSLKNEQYKRFIAIASNKSLSKEKIQDSLAKFGYKANSDNEQDIKRVWELNKILSEKYPTLKTIPKDVRHKIYRRADQFLQYRGISII